MRVRDGISLSVGVSALVVSVLGVGGAVRGPCVAVAALVAVALAFELPSRRHPARLSPLITLIAIAAALTALQLIPLPDTVLHSLDPTGDTLRHDGAVLARTSPWPSISLDPSATTRALTYFVTLLGVALLGLRFSTTERGRFYLLGGVAITCGIAALVSGVHRLLSADTLYGYYEPAHLKAVVGPLLNRNHMGGLMAIGTVLAAALAFYRRQPTQLRVLWVCVMIGCAVVCATTLSRGAILGMGIGLLVAGGVLIAPYLSNDRRRRRLSLRRELPVGLAIGVGLAVALYMSAGGVVDQLGDTTTSEFDKPVSKYEAWKSSLHLVAETPWVGVGRGAVEATLTRVHPASGEVTFSHLENEYLTTILDWGIPGAVAIALGFGMCIALALRRWNDGPLAAAALGALAMIAFQSCVDFGVEMLGIAVPVTIIASTIMFVPFRPAASVARVRLVRIAMIAALLVSAAALMLPITQNVQEAHDDLTEGTPTMEEVRDSIERHPLDYFGFGEAADLASSANDIHAVEFLNHALVLHPTHAGLHRIAARMLVGLKDYKQAAIEYALALQIDPLPHQLLLEIITLIPNVEDVTAALPLDYPSIDLMLHSLKELNRTDVSEHWLARIAALPHHDIQVIDTLYDLAMTNNDFPVARSAANLRLSLEATTTSRLMLAKVQFKQYDLLPLMIELADVRNWMGRNDEKSAAWLILCDVYIAEHAWEPGLECLHHLDASGLQGASHYDISKRLDNINGERSYESKMEAAKALEKSLDAKHHE